MLGEGAGGSKVTSLYSVVELLKQELVETVARQFVLHVCTSVFLFGVFF